MATETKKNPVQALIDKASNAHDAGDAMKFSQAAVNCANAQAVSKSLGISDEQVGFMVGRFLQWILPSNFGPDGGISYDRSAPGVPTGTNLLDAGQAEALVRHMINGI